MNEGAGDLQPLVLALATGVGAASIYPAGHPRIDESAARVVRELERLLAERGDSEVTLLVVDGEMVVDGRPLRHVSMSLQPLLKAFARRRVQRLTLAAGLIAAECREFLEALLGRGKLRSLDHLIVGRVMLGTGGAELLDETGVLEGLLPLSERDVDQAQEAFAAFAGGAVEQLDRIVWRFMDGLAQATPALLLLAPIKDRRQAMFVHALNVGLLTVLQARSLGIEGTVLHDLGVAGMLHDIGETQLPTDLPRDGAGRLTEAGWELVKSHTELGAAMLAGMEGVPPIAVQVAYEHHLRWDGQPSFPERARGRYPSFASQLVAVADSYDTMVASRGLQTAEARPAAMRVWQQRAGSWLDPFLVSSFTTLLANLDKAGAPAPGGTPG